MVTKQSPPNTRERAIEMRNAWIQIGTEVQLSTLQFTEFEQAEQAFADVEAEIARLESELTHARNQRTDRRYDLWQILKRARLAVLATYGEDSSEYELFGGTRLSEQKSKGSHGTPEPAQT